MKIQIFALVALVALSVSDAVKEDETTQIRRLGGKNKRKKKSGDKPCTHARDIIPFPVACVGGDLDVSGIGTKNEVCLRLGDGLCRERSDWIFGVTALRGLPDGGFPDIEFPDIPVIPPKPTLPDIEQINAEDEPFMGNGNGGIRRMRKLQFTHDRPSRPDPQPPVPPTPPGPSFNSTEASAFLYEGCNPVFEFPFGTTEVCIGLVGTKDFPNGLLTGSTYLVFKNATLPEEIVDDLPNVSDDEAEGDYWVVFEPLASGTYKAFPRLKLVPDPNTDAVLKLKRGPTGKDDEDALLVWNKDGTLDTNPEYNVYWAPDGDRAEAVKLPTF